MAFSLCACKKSHAPKFVGTWADETYNYTLALLEDGSAVLKMGDTVYNSSYLSWEAEDYGTVVLKLDLAKYDFAMNSSKPATTPTTGTEGTEGTEGTAAAGAAAGTGTAGNAAAGSGEAPFSSAASCVSCSFFCCSRCWRARARARLRSARRCLRSARRRFLASRSSLLFCVLLLLPVLLIVTV